MGDRVVAGVSMTLVVKRVKRHLYVYEQYRVDGRVVTLCRSAGGDC